MVIQLQLCNIQIIQFGCIWVGTILVLVLAVEDGGRFLLDMFMVGQVDEGDQGGDLKFRKIFLNFKHFLPFSVSHHGRS